MPHNMIDKNTTTGKYERLVDSDKRGIFTTWNLHYRPNVIVDFWTGVTIPLYVKAANGLYENPGRLRADYYYRFGMTVYFKFW